MSYDEARVRELQGALRTKMAENKSIADSFKVEDGTVVVSSEQKSAFDSNMRDIREIRSLIDGLEQMKDVDGWSREEGNSVAVEYNAKSAENALYEAARDMGFKGSVGTIQRDPIVTPPTRTKRVRDLFPTRTTTAAVIEYFRQLGFTSAGGGTNAAASVAERNGGNTAFGAKPQSSMVFVGEQAPVRTLAHWEAAHRNVLADEPQLRSIIDNELMYGLRLLEDSQILNGDGTGENLQGVLQTTGIQEYAWSEGAHLPVADNKADAIRRAATLSFLSYYEPTGVVLHPNDWEDMELAKDDQGQYLVAVSVALGGEQRIWRMPVIDTPAIAEGTALVGAFGTGAQLYDREQASIRISEQHADFFVRNAIVVLAEQRLALAVKRPEAFVKVDFDAAPTA